MVKRYKIAKGKDRLADLFPADSRLSSARFRILIGLFNHLRLSESGSATLSDVAKAAARSEAEVAEALEVLIALGYVEARHEGGDSPPERTAGNAATAVSLSIWSESSGTSAMCFMNWLRFVLRPEEWECFDRLTITLREELGGWVDRFAAARSVGRDDGLLDDIRRRLALEETSPAPITSMVAPVRQRPRAS